MVFRPNEYHNKDGIGMPADDIALNTTDPNTSVALLKGIFGKLGGGTTTAACNRQGARVDHVRRARRSSRAPSRRPRRPTPPARPIRSALVGALTEAAPGGDATSSGLNGRLQRIAQKLEKLDDICFLLVDSAEASAVALDQIHLDLLRVNPLPNGTLRLPSAAATTNGTAGVVGPCRMFNIQGLNAAAATRYLKLYDLARIPVVGTDTPAKTLALPSLSAFAFDWATPYPFRNGLAYALTTGAADGDTAALTAADIVGLNIDYG
jgi:hypothetical protein